MTKYRWNLDDTKIKFKSNWWGIYAISNDWEMLSAVFVCQYDCLKIERSLQYVVGFLGQGTHLCFAGRWYKPRSWTFDRTGKLSCQLLVIQPWWVDETNLARWCKKYHLHQDILTSRRIEPQFYRKQVFLFWSCVGCQKLARGPQKIYGAGWK